MRGDRVLLVSHAEEVQGLCDARIEVYLEANVMASVSVRSTSLDRPCDRQSWLSSFMVTLRSYELAALANSSATFVGTERPSRPKGGCVL